MRKLIPLAGTLLATLALGACGGDETPTPADRLPLDGTPVAVVDTVIVDAFDASGVAEPVRAATLSTKLMGSVTAVLVHEGDRVAAGQLLVRLDARDLDAKLTQVEAGLAEATAVHDDAVAQVGRIRALYADSAATRAQLDQAETGLARAEAAGYRALVLTVDTPVLGRRERDVRNGFKLPPNVKMANFTKYGAHFERWNFPGWMAARAPFAANLRMCVEASRTDAVSPTTLMTAVRVMTVARGRRARRWLPRSCRGPCRAPRIPGRCP